MNRRDTVLALAALGASPALCNAQQPKMPMIGLLGSESPVVWTRHLRAFHEGLSELGYVDGRNVAIEYRWADGHNDRGRGDRVTDRGRTGRVARRTGVGPVPPRTEVGRRSDAASRNAGKDCHEHGGARWDDSQ